jgi:hypothetical protein
MPLRRYTPRDPSGGITAQPSRGGKGPQGISMTQVLQSAGFRGDGLIMARAIAMAESSGKTDAISNNPDGNENYGWFQIDSVNIPTVRNAGVSNPQDLLDPTKNSKAAYILSKGGTDWRIWSTAYGDNGKYLGANAPFRHYYGMGDFVAKPPATGRLNPGGLDPGIGIHPLSWTKSIANLISIIVNPTSLGQLIAQGFAVFIRYVFKALWDYVILFFWHKTERATDYYWNNNISMGPVGQSSSAVDKRWNRSMFTVGFWGLGYFLLWGKADQDEVALTGNNPHKTVLGRNISQGMHLWNRRGLKKGKKAVEEATPAKPRPVESTVPLTVNRTVTATRRRTVKVTSTGSITPNTMRASGTETITPEEQDDILAPVIPADFGGPSERTGRPYPRGARRGGGN